MSTTLAFLGSIATSVMTLVGVFVGSRLSYGRSIKEKFWDVRREAYRAILSKLAEVDRITKGGDDWIAAQGLKNYDRLGEDRDKIAKHMIVVWQKYSDNHLVMSDEFVRIFENFISENDAGDPNDATASLHLSRRKIITKVSRFAARAGEEGIGARSRGWLSSPTPDFLFSPHAQYHAWRRE